MSESCVQVTAGVIVRDRRVLVCQRAPGGRHPYKWEFPGGKVEADESLEACMRRELREELGISATVGRRLGETLYRYPGRDLIALIFFLIDAYEGMVTNRVFAAVEWVPLEELPRLDFLDADRAFVMRMASGEVDVSGPTRGAR